MNNLKTHMYNWVINYNPFTGQWQAARKENMLDLYSNKRSCIVSSSLDTLIEILNRTDGDKGLIKKLLKNGK